MRISDWSSDVCSSDLARWAGAVPPGFVFTIKATRFCTNRKILADAGESIQRFLGQGLTELGEKLGPILWQFMPTKRSEERRVGKEGVSTCRSRGEPDHVKKK